MYAIIGTTVNEVGDIQEVHLYDISNNRTIKGDYKGFLTNAPRLAIMNFDLEKLEPTDGWDAVAKFNSNGVYAGEPVYTLLNGTADGGYLIVDHNGKLYKLAHYAELLDFAERANLLNWYGYSVMNGRPYFYKEVPMEGDISYGKRPTGTPGNRVTRRDVNKPPRAKKEKEEIVFDDGTVFASFRTSCIGDQEKVTEWTEQYFGGVGERNKVLQENERDLLENFNHCEEDESDALKAQFTNETRFNPFKKYASIVPFPYSNADGTVTYGLGLEYSKDGKAAAWVIAPPIYKRITVCHAESTPIAFCQKVNNDIELIKLKTSESLSALTEMNKKFKIKDFLNTNLKPGAKSTLLLGCEVEEGNEYLYWYVVDKDLNIKKSIACRMKVAGQTSKANKRKYGTLSVAEFEDRQGGSVLLNLKDFSYDSRIVFNKNKSKDNTDSTAVTRENPKWADIALDFTDGTINIKDEFERQSKVGPFTNLSQSVIPLMKQWFGVESTHPMNKDVKVRRHTESHLLSEFLRVDYDKVEAVMATLTKFEQYSDATGWMNYCVFNKISTPELLEEEFDVDDFDVIVECGDKNELRMKACITGLNNSVGSGNVTMVSAVMNIFFWRRGAGVQSYSFTIINSGKSCDLGKVTLSPDNLKGLVNTIMNQQNVVQVYRLRATKSTLLNTTENVGITAPLHTREFYAKSHTTLYDVTSTLKLPMVSCEVCDTNDTVVTSFNLFFGFYDGISFRTSKEEIPSTEQEDVTVGERAVIYSKVMNPNKPLLGGTLPSVFKISLA